MDAITGLGHFCETHGPCVMLSTQRSKEEPKQFPHSLTVPVCESCQSINLDQAFVSKDGNTCYVTTRTPLVQDLAFLLKQATVRSLSCEVSEDSSQSGNGGPIYFGDNERGHVLSQTFSLQDSLARGFHRKYAIIILMKDKIHLLNCWPHLTQHIKEIIDNLQKKSSQVNDLEQAQKSQRSIRQSQKSPTNTSRSLSQLTGEPTIFAQLHMWFTFLIAYEPVVEKSYSVPELPIKCKAEYLRTLAKEMDETVFRTIAYCILTSIRIEADQVVINAFRQLLPTYFNLPSTGDVCKVSQVDGKWCVLWPGQLPPKLPNLLVLAEKALKNDKLPMQALEPHLTSLVMQWYNISCCFKWTPTQNPELFQSLGVHKCDLPLLTYWTTQQKSNK